VFTCVNCGRKVSEKAPGTHNRNHCPYCLYSIHIDNEVGDRKSACKGKMRPVGKTFKKDGEEVVVHECEVCGFVRKNRVAGDDSIEGVDNLPNLL
jgi:DNA-directed RNA polymerase subunit RPC12/RpoP